MPPSDWSDHELVETICNGGTKFQEAVKYLLLTLCHDAVSWWSRSRQGEYEHDDLMNDVLLHLRGKENDWKPLRVWRNESSLKGFLKTVVTNLHFTRMRNRKRETDRLPSISLSALDDELNVKSVNSQTDAIERERKLSEIRRAMKQISKQERLVTDLFYFQELSLLEIAEIMGITLNNVGVIKSRAIQKLRNILGGLSDDA